MERQAKPEASVEIDPSGLGSAIERIDEVIFSPFRRAGLSHTMRCQSVGEAA